MADVHAEFYNDMDKSLLHLVYRIDSRLFAIAVGRVEEVVLPGDINEIPGSSRELCGIMNLRGEALPIVDTHHIFGTKIDQDRSQDNAPLSQHLVVINSTQGRFGLTVDKALKVARLSPLPLPTGETGIHATLSTIQSYALDNGDTVLIVDPDALSSRGQS